MTSMFLAFNFFLLLTLLVELTNKLIEFLVNACCILNKAKFRAHFLDLVLPLDCIPALAIVLLHLFYFFDVVAELVYFTLEPKAFKHSSLFRFGHLIMIKDSIHDPSDIVSFFISLLCYMHSIIIHNF